MDIDNNNTNNNPTDNQWGMEWWYNAHFTYGIIQMVFIPILIPTFVLEATGKASLAGLLMAIIGLGGLAAPVIGGLADKYRAHRIAQLGGLLAFALGGVLFAFAGEILPIYYLGSICLGIGSATLLMINPTFIVGASFSPASEALRLTRLNQILIVGQLVAGLGLGFLTSQGLSYPARFLVMSGVAIASLILTFATNREAASRIKVDISEDNQQQQGKTSIIQILWSNYGVLLLAIFMVQIAGTVMSGQYPNYMQKVFNIDSSESSIALSVSSVVTLIVLGIVGKWMEKKGPSPIWLTAIFIFTGVGIGLIGLGLFRQNMASFLPLALYVTFLQAVSWQDMVQPALASRFSTAGAATTQGLLLFAVAVGYALGSVIAGDAADQLGFQSLPWIVAITAAIGIVIGVKSFAQQRKKRKIS